MPTATCSPCWGSAGRLRVAEWNDDDIALVDSVGADLGRAIVQASLYERQSELVRQLQDLDRAKSEFLSTFSHELRTPLTSIRAYTELLRDEGDEVDPDQDRMLEVIEKNSVRLSVLIEDILTLSHLNSAVYDIHLVRVDANPLVRAVVESLLPTAASKGLSLEARTCAGPGHGAGRRQPAGAPPAEPGHQRRQVHPAGGTDPGGDVGHVHVGGPLGDRRPGSGSPPASRRPSSVGSSAGPRPPSELIPGTGLGLAIVQAIVEHHGGTLSLASAPRPGDDRPGPPPVGGRRRGVPPSPGSSPGRRRR